MPTLDARGRVTLPSPVRKRLNLQVGGQVIFAEVEGFWVIQCADQRPSGQTCEQADRQAEGKTTIAVQKSSPEEI
jgi:AbrB family looped-hinge helix DNA binding protein